jgi:hypothetical protein
MRNKGNYSGQEQENWRMSRKPHEQDTDQYKRYGYRGGNEDHRQWDEGNYFHTGPSPRGAQDSPEKRYGENYQHDRNSTYAQERNEQLRDHYGEKPDSPYRKERSYIDHGQKGYQHSDMHSMRRPHTPEGSLQASTQDESSYRNERWREGPGNRSRYKETDFRYGSGSHNWYREGRYTPDNANQGDRGFMNRVKDTWHDIWHSDEPGYQPRISYEDAADRVDSHKRYGSEAYRDRRIERDYEGGTRRPDSDSNNYRNDINYTKRYRH